MGITSEQEDEGGDDSCPGSDDGSTAEITSRRERRRKGCDAKKQKIVGNAFARAFVMLFQRREERVDFATLSSPV